MTARSGGDRNAEAGGSSPDVESQLPLGAPMFHILLALGDEALHGYAIQQRFEEESGGGRILPGTLYSTLAKMSERRLVEEVEPEPDPERDARRRYYRVTDWGRQVATAEAARMQRLVELARRRAMLPER